MSSGAEWKLPLDSFVAFSQDAVHAIAGLFLMLAAALLLQSRSPAAGRGLWFWPRRSSTSSRSLGRRVAGHNHSIWRRSQGPAADDAATDGPACCLPHFFHGYFEPKRRSGRGQLKRPRPIARRRYRRTGLSRSKKGLQSVPQRLSAGLRAVPMRASR